MLQFSDPKKKNLNYLYSDTGELKPLHRLQDWKSLDYRPPGFDTHQPGRMPAIQMKNRGVNLLHCHRAAKGQSHRAD